VLGFPERRRLELPRPVTMAAVPSLAPICGDGPENPHQVFDAGDGCTMIWSCSGWVPGFGVNGHGSQATPWNRLPACGGDMWDKYLAQIAPGTSPVLSIAWIARTELAVVAHAQINPIGTWHRLHGR
jgi:hypothetical protein